MTTFIDVIRKRRSVREFLKKPVEPEKIDLLVEAALRAPSSRGLDPWEFIVVTDRELLQKLSGSKPHGSDFLAGAPLGMVACANTAKSDVWVEDASIASIYIWLAAEALGLGACWIQIRQRSHDENQSARDYIAQLLRLPTHLQVEAIVAVGYPKRKNPPHLKSNLKYDKVSVNFYRKPCSEKG
ncbi:MAG: nitroreductase family protein [Proteobacteria bacterium]|nr:nitroreductase family protein [Pseudomonadota bacterium]